MTEFCMQTIIQQAGKSTSQRFKRHDFCLWAFPTIILWWECRGLFVVGYYVINMIWDTFSLQIQQWTLNYYLRVSMAFAALLKLCDEICYAPFLDIFLISSSFYINSYTCTYRVVFKCLWAKGVRFRKSLSLRCEHSLCRKLFCLATLYIFYRIFTFNDIYFNFTDFMVNNSKEKRNLTFKKINLTLLLNVHFWREFLWNFV